MSVHQLINPFVALDNLLGTAKASGGKLYFYELDATTLKDTWQEFDKSTLNENPVTLDSAGRVPAPVWGDGDYTVAFHASDDTVIVAATEFRDPAPAEAGLPDATGHDGEYLTATGGTYAWSGPWWPNPDPTGSPGEMVVANGSGDAYILQPQPTVEVPEPDIVIADTSVIIGDGSGERWMEQTGTGTIPAAAARTSNTNITFPVAFTKIRHVEVTASTYAVNEYGAGATLTAAGFTVGSAASSATITANIVDDGGDSGDSIVNPVSFTWKASGLVAAA